jgi:hypothetical protein
MFLRKGKTAVMNMKANDLIVPTVFNEAASDCFRYESAFAHGLGARVTVARPDPFLPFPSLARTSP